MTLYLTYRLSLFDRSAALLLGRASAVPFLGKGFAVLVLGAALLIPLAAAAAPYRPAEDATVLERLPTPGDGAKRELRRLRAKLSDDPRNLTLALDLARRYIGAGRAEADPRYYGYAEAALAPWWDQAMPPVEVMVLRAVILQNRHDFAAALAELDRVLDARPGHPQARLTQAFVLQVLGRNGEARESCRRLPGAVGPLIAGICLSRVESLTGRAAEAHDRLRRAVAEAPETPAPIKLWALTNLAEIARRAGRPEAAEEHFKAARALGRRDAYLQGAYADFLLDRGRAEEARRLLDGEMRVDGLLLRLALAGAELGDAAVAGHIAALEARFAASRMRGDVRHLREEARFVLHLLRQPERALDLALENWALQREPSDARLVLEAALAVGAPERAEPVLAWLEKSGFQDPTHRALARRLAQGDI